jgi:hypothetical protein
VRPGPWARARLRSARVRAAQPGKGQGRGLAEARPRAPQLAFHELAALYAITDVALVTSLRDGMNLVSYEYVACQSDNAGARPAPTLAGVSLPWSRPPAA